MAKQKSKSRIKETSLVINRQKVSGSRDLIKKLPAKDKKVMLSLLDQNLGKVISELSGKNKVVVNKMISNQSEGISGNEELSPLEFFDKYLAKDANVSKEKIEEIKKDLSGAGKSSIGDLLQVDVPVKRHPVLSKEHRKKYNTFFGSLAGLSEKSLESFVKADVRYDEIDSIQLDKLIKGKVINKTQVKELYLISNLSRLTGDNIPLIKALKKEGLTGLDQLIGRSRKEWTDIISTKKVELPEGIETKEKYADTIFNNLKNTYPTKYLFHRFSKEDVSEKVKQISGIEELKKNNKRILGRGNFNSQKINWKGISKKKKSIEKQLNEFSKFANTYEYLGVKDIVNNQSLDFPQKAELIVKRHNAFLRFGKNNESIRISQQDFIKNTDAFDWKGISKAEKDPVRKQMMAIQRIERLTKDPEVTLKVLGAGFGSARAIAEVDEKIFFTQSGLDFEKSRQLYVEATSVTGVTGHFIEAVRDNLLASYELPGFNAQGSLVNDLKDIDGYDDLFGNQDFCDCDHCRSILSPAAYFTDLMYFIQEHVSDKYFDPDSPNHPLYLKSRRPDLWELVLSCKNANEELPYLQIVNEVLESYLKRASEITNVYEYISNSHYSWHLPTNVPLKELRIYLSHFEESLYSIYSLLDQTKSLRLREKLKLSQVDLDLISTKDTTRVHNLLQNSDLSKYPVKDFMEITKLSREDVDDWLQVKFNLPIRSISILMEKDPSDIQKYFERFKGLNPVRLDLLFRYEKLRNHTPWTVREFDLIVKGFSIASGRGILANGSEGFPNFLNLGNLIQIQEDLNLTIEELASIIYRIPDEPLEIEGQSFYDRLFDREKLFGIASSNNGDVIYHSTFVLPADRSTDDKTPMMLAGLGVTEMELNILFDLLAMDVTIDRNISIVDLSNLYRSARIAQGLRWSIEDYKFACALVLNGLAVSDIEDVLQLLEFKNSLSKSFIQISHLHFILTKQESISQKFSITNKEIVEFVFGLKSDAIDQKREKLNLFLGGKFNLTEDQLNTDYFGVLLSLALDSTEIDTALNAIFDTNDNPIDPSAFDDLEVLIKEIETWQLIFKKLELELEEISFIAQNPDILGINDLTGLTYDNVFSLTSYSILVKNKEKEEIEQLNEVMTDMHTNGSFSSQSINDLASIWSIAVGIMNSIALTFSSSMSNDLIKLKEIVDLTLKLGVAGPTLSKLTTLNTYKEIETGRDIVLGAIESKYPEETKRKEVLEPFEGKINELRRDALCDAIIGKKDVFKFKDHTDLYSFFLLDVDMSGCFLSSRIVCANSSLQLYVHRCLLNLEQSDDALNPNIENIRVLPADIPQDEWNWRKYYRVWEANRKVFLYPENYLDPALRDTKTHIFKELEEELLQEKISQSSAENAYKKYLTQFSELTKLRYAGAYYHSVPNDFGYYSFQNSNGTTSYIPLTGTMFTDESHESQFYLFARTNTDPYQYFYRTYNHYKSNWGNWVKMEVAIEADEISSLMFNGRLYIFWTQVVSKEVSRINGGSSNRSGYDFKVYAKYCYKKEDDTWTAPQQVFVGHTTQDEEIIFERVNLRSVYLQGEDARDKIVESVLEKYQKVVFKKPYVFKSGDIQHPIGLNYLWSQNQGVSNYIYILDAKPVSVLDNDYLFLPNIQFTYIGESQNISTILRLNMPNGNHFGDFMIACTFTLTSAGSCTFELKATLNNVDINIIGSTIIRISSVPLNIQTSSFDLSISRNEIINSRAQEIEAYPLNSSGLLKPEYDAVYQNDSAYYRHVENGTRAFPVKLSRIFQTQSGEAHLDFPNYSSTGTLESMNLIPLNTIDIDPLIDILYAQGLEQFLSIETQNQANLFGESLQLDSSYGEYYWELFFHIPFLIANHLNANQKFKEAKWWYERIFDPTASEELGHLLPFDHVWRFKAFRNQAPQKLQDILTDANAITAYEEDPFDPHAIARLRVHAYQKAIVMKYIDNLIDWGDYLYSKDTRETITEAIQHYKLAYDLLGRRPCKLGKCETADEAQLTYDKIRERIDLGSEFLITLENSYYIIHQENEWNYQANQVNQHLTKVLTHGDEQRKLPSKLMDVKEASTFVDVRKKLADAAKSIGQTSSKNNGSRVVQGPLSIDLKDQGLRIAKLEDAFKTKSAVYDFRNAWDDHGVIDMQYVFQNEKPRPSRLELVKETILAFCVPDNKDLIDYWDRVEDRMYKIHNCMNISGVVRKLSLFSPPIDPNFLVRATAMGLSLEDVLGALNPTYNYRYSFLVEKARQLTSTVQGLGSALLSALEKKDGEELTLLRSVHEQNVLKLSMSIKKKRIEEAKHQVKAFKETLKNIENRIEYYEELIDEGLIPWEITQQVSKHAAAIFKGIEGAMHLTQGITYLIPQLGSPFSMKYGGKELGDSADGFAQWLRSMASVSDSISASAGLEAGNQRREEEWKNQLKLAKQELKSSNQQMLAAEVRLAIAEKDLEIQLKTIDQAKEIHDFYKGKFTSLSLYNHLASNLTRIYREAYNLAKDLAEQAQAAYQIEIFDDSNFIEGSNWDTSKAGLLAAERLLLQLQQMDNSYLEKNVRTPEITQTFSLAMIAPLAINELRQLGSCEFIIPEIAFELLYPGQFRRLIKAVRISIPAVVGPYINVSAKLTLLDSYLELEDDGNLTQRTVGLNTSLTTSSAQNDSGMFEFNFRDERYLPFEGAGVVDSKWKLDLPSKIRVFNYDSISDVLITISYTALDGNRQSAEDNLVSKLETYAAAEGLFRILSLKHEFPNEYHKLFAGQATDPQTTKIPISENHFPYFTRNKSINMQSASLFLKPQNGKKILGSPNLSVKGTNVIWVTNQDIPHSTNPTNASKVDKLKAGSLNISGSPLVTWDINAGVGGLNKDDIDDILILVKYKLN